MVDVTSIRPMNEGLGHSFCYQSISHTTSCNLSIVTFAIGRTVYPQYITSQTTTTTTTDAQACRNSATVLSTVD